jgi:hypothetical protein
MDIKYIIQGMHPIMAFSINRLPEWPIRGIFCSEP